jgi:hypothetical protein
MIFNGSLQVESEAGTKFIFCFLDGTVFQKGAGALRDNHSFFGFLKLLFPIFEIGCFLQRLNLWNYEIKSVDSWFEKRVKCEAISESSASN